MSGCGYALRHPNPETGRRNMTTGTKLAPSAATGVKAIAVVPPSLESRETLSGDDAPITTGKVLRPRELITPGPPRGSSSRPWLSS